MRFFKSFKKLFPVLVPSFLSVETGYAALVAAMLVLRTSCDLWMISNSTHIEASIIARDPAQFRKYVLRFVSLMLPIAVVNQLLKLGLQEMKIRFRNNITQFLYNKYFRGYTYYQVSNIDSRIQNVDQLLTTDSHKFCESVVDLYSNVSKPFLDLCLYSKALVSSHGASAPVTMLGYLALAASTLTTLRRPLSKFTVQEQQLEGEFRFVNSRLITNSEEIAFYGGNKRETAVVQSVFSRLIKHLRRAMEFRFSMGVIDNICAKYIAMIVGFYVVSRPFMDFKNERMNQMQSSELMTHYYQSGRMLVKMGEAVGRLVLAGRELSRLAGFTDRVDELSRVLDDLNHGKYERTMVSTRTATGADAAGAAASAGGDSLINRRGKLVFQDHVILFENVPLVTPNGDVLVKSLNFRVDAGVNTFIAGPNGCGKSSLFRILGELWPLFGGTLTKPRKNELFYVPQRPYMCLGSLRDQIIYPDSEEDMKKKGFTDADLMDLLALVKLEHLVEREGGFGAVNDWMDVLSGGEKQRIAMTRVFYNKPQFSILDECTSAVSVDVEAKIYDHCRQVGITLFTISHRKTLWQFHSKIIAFDGRGNVEFMSMDDWLEQGN